MNTEDTHDLPSLPTNSYAPLVRALHGLVQTPHPLSAQDLEASQRPYFYRVERMGPLLLTELGGFLVWAAPSHPQVAQIDQRARAWTPARQPLFNDEQELSQWGLSALRGALARVAEEQAEAFPNLKPPQPELLARAARQLFWSCPPRGLLGIGQGSWPVPLVALWVSSCFPLPGISHEHRWSHQAISCEALERQLLEGGLAGLGIGSATSCLDELRVMLRAHGSCEGAGGHPCWCLDCLRFHDERAWRLQTSP